MTCTERRVEPLEKQHPTWLDPRCEPSQSGQPLVHRSDQRMCPPLCITESANHVDRLIDISKRRWFKIQYSRGNAEVGNQSSDILVGDCTDSAKLLREDDIGHDAFQQFRVEGIQSTCFAELLPNFGIYLTCVKPGRQLTRSYMRLRRG